jgi:sucrose-6-phosphate hydrolase SacC (GH32 family)
LAAGRGPRSPKFGDKPPPLIRIRNAWHEFRYGNRSIPQAKWNARYHYALGKDFYATLSFSNLPPSDGRRIWMGWTSNWLYANEEPTVTWRGAQSVPRELGLRRTPDGIRLVQAPIRELRSLRASAEPRAVSGTVNPSDANVRVLQTLTGGKTIETAWAPVDASTGAFSFELAVQATVRTAYSANAASTTFVADSPSAGRYTIEASSAGTVRALAVDTNAAVAPVTVTVP